MSTTRVPIPARDLAVKARNDLRARLETPIAELLDQRTVNALEDELGILYVKDLVRVPREVILRLPNIGPTTVTMIEQRLGSLGLSLT